MKICLKKSDRDLMQGLVSILIPAYKETYLAEAIESALKQDYQNIELVIVNDKSPYDLCSVVSQFHDDRIRYYENEENLGGKNVVRSWNRCLEYARGEFFVLLCDDDILMPNFVSELLALANKYPKCNVFHARRYVRNEQVGSSVEDNVWPEWEGVEDFYKKMFEWQRIHTITEFMYRTKHILANPYIEFPLAWGADDISVLNLVKDGGIASSGKCLAVFRESEEHISQVDNRLVEKAKARILNYEWYESNFVGESYNVDYRDTLSEILVNFVRTASFLDKFQIIVMVPRRVWSIKKKLWEIAMIFIGHRTRPSQRSLGV